MSWALKTQGLLNWIKDTDPPDMSQYFDWIINYQHLVQEY